MSNTCQVQNWKFAFQEIDILIELLMRMQINGNRRLSAFMKMPDLAMNRPQNYIARYALPPCKKKKIRFVSNYIKQNEDYFDVNLLERLRIN